MLAGRCIDGKQHRDGGDGMAVQSFVMTTRNMARPGRNEPCRCGSGRKYKHCCLDKDEQKAVAARAEAAKESPAPTAEEAPATNVRSANPKTEQPWKTGRSTRGFVPRSRMPRKVGGG